jgi:hypothetical protein
MIEQQRERRTAACSETDAELDRSRGPVPYRRRSLQRGRTRQPHGRDETGRARSKRKRRLFSGGHLSRLDHRLCVLTIQSEVRAARKTSAIKTRDPAQIAAFGLAIPPLLNPAGHRPGDASADSDGFVVFATVLGGLAVARALDVGVFRVANRPSAHLSESRTLATEKVFGFLLAAIAVQAHAQRTPERRRHPLDHPPLCRIGCAGRSPRLADGEADRSGHDQTSAPGSESDRTNESRRTTTSKPSPC